MNSSTAYYYSVITHSSLNFTYKLNYADWEDWQVSSANNVSHSRTMDFNLFGDGLRTLPRLMDHC